MIVERTNKKSECELLCVCASCARARHKQAHIKVHAGVREEEKHYDVTCIAKTNRETNMPSIFVLGFNWIVLYYTQHITGGENGLLYTYILMVSSIYTIYMLYISNMFCINIEQVQHMCNGIYFSSLTVYYTHTHVCVVCCMYMSDLRHYSNKTSCGFIYLPLLFLYTRANATNLLCCFSVLHAGKKIKVYTRMYVYM